MSDEKKNVTKTVKSTNIRGEECTYTFNLMDAETGLKLFHQYVILLVSSYKSMLAAVEGKDDVSFLGILKEAPQIIDWVIVERLAKDMLPGYTAEVNGVTNKANDKGFMDSFGSPLDIYRAIQLALFANYGDDIAGLMNLLGQEDDDSTPGKE